jgi:hypothetical protein
MQTTILNLHRGPHVCRALAVASDVRCEATMDQWRGENVRLTRWAPTRRFAREQATEIYRQPPRMCTTLIAELDSICMRTVTSVQ